VTVTGNGPLGAKENPYLESGVVAVKTGPVWMLFNVSNVVAPRPSRVRFVCRADGRWAVQTEDLTDA
jgi:hypothetical protein